MGRQELQVFLFVCVVGWAVARPQIFFPGEEGLLGFPGQQRIPGPGGRRPGSVVGPAVGPVVAPIAVAPIAPASIAPVAPVAPAPIAPVVPVAPAAPAVVPGQTGAAGIGSGGCKGGSATGTGVGQANAGQGGIGVGIGIGIAIDTPLGCITLGQGQSIAQGAPVGIPNGLFNQAQVGK